MSGESRVRELLEEILNTGRSAEDVCQTCPEMLPQVQASLRRLRAVQARVDIFFPESTSSQYPGTAPHFQLAAELPAIPGYEVQAVLGRGGVGVVFKAWHLSLRRPVALKMLLAGDCATHTERERFLREADAEAGLQHPNVVQVHDVGEHEGRPYFTMEFIDGGSLAEKLRGVPQPALQAAALVKTLAQAVHAAHTAGIVHRDLKPANVLLTSDGTPKISDFGLARRREDVGLTQSGVPMGTPSYMAPEQALGKSREIGPAADTYALGAILYELLTGRPPYQGESAAETVQQVISQEPVPPSRLNFKVPRDLETICLKCLNKEPGRRYASAGELAEDLRRLQEGQAIHARPVRGFERLWRWCRRKPSAAALVATGLALCALIIGGGWWLERREGERRADKARQEGRAAQAVEAVLEQARAFQEEGRWPEARAALVNAPSLVGISATPELQRRLRQARAHADMVAELEEIRLRLSDGRKSRKTAAFSPEKAYAGAFRNYGITLEQNPVGAAERVRSSPIRETLLAFLHDWLFWVSDGDRGILLSVIDRADDSAWRQAFRQALAVRDIGKLRMLASAPEAADQPAVVLSGLGGMLMASEHKKETLALLRAAQQRHPGDFWINMLLGHFWDQERPHEAVGYFRVAVTVRPSSGQASAMLGRALRDAGDADGAVAAFRKAIELNANYGAAKDLAGLLAARGGLEEARELWEKFLGEAEDHESWYGYAPLCLYLDKKEAYCRARKALLELFANTDDWVVAERTSIACLLLPMSGDELRRAVALADRAMAAGEKSLQASNPYLFFAKGLADYRQGRHEQPILLLKQAAEKLASRPGPRLVLAMSQFQSGSPKEARQSLAQAVLAYNWNRSKAVHGTVWVSHVLRREAESMILPNLPAFLRGEYQPTDNDERLALLGICQFQGLYGAAARLYAGAFAADPELAESLTEQCLQRALKERPEDQIETLDAACRYLAARCAVLAGCGLDKHGPALLETQRAHWRKQAREWLRADLATWAKTLAGDSAVVRDLAKKLLAHWQTDPELSELREPAALNKMSVDERSECLTLWQEVAAVLDRK